MYFSLLDRSHRSTPGNECVERGHSEVRRGGPRRDNGSRSSHRAAKYLFLIRAHRRVV